MSGKKTYHVYLRDADAQPIDSWECWGMAEVRERIEIAREDFAHYPALQFLVRDEAGVCVIDRTYRSKEVA